MLEAAIELSSSMNAVTPRSHEAECIYSSSSSSSPSSSSIVVCAMPVEIAWSAKVFLIPFYPKSRKVPLISLPPSTPYQPEQSKPLCHSRLPHTIASGKNSRSKSLLPLCVILLPPLSSSCSNTPIFSKACTTFRSTLPLAST